MRYFWSIYKNSCESYSEQKARQYGIKAKNQINDTSCSIYNKLKSKKEENNIRKQRI